MDGIRKEQTMKRMIYLAAALLLMGTQAFAQARFGAGYLNAAERTISGNTTEKADLNGFYVGFHYNLNIVAGLGVATGLYADMLFANREESVWLVTGKGKFSELDLNLPIQLNYTFPLNRDFSLIVYGGPTLQYGIFKKAKYTASIGSASESTTVDYYKDANNKPFNVYLGGGAGFQAGNIQVLIGYDHSLINMIESENVKQNRSQIKIGVGFAF